MRKWSAADEQLLREALERGGLADVECAFPGKSVASLRRKADRMNLAVAPYQKPPWTMPETRSFTALWNAGVTRPEITRILGRSDHAIGSKATQLGLVARRAPAWNRGQRAVVQRAVDELLADLAVKLRRSPNAVGNAAVKALLAVAMRRPAVRRLSARHRGGRAWRAAEYGLVERSCAALVDHLELRLGRRRRAVANVAIRCVCSAPRRYRSSAITDMGGMAVAGSARTGKRAA